MEIVWYLTAAIFLILGLAGCFISILPGPILSYLALLCLIPTDKCLSAATLLFFGVLTIIVTVADLPSNIDTLLGSAVNVGVAFEIVNATASVVTLL